jgi:hypothetical protein
VRDLIKAKGPKSVRGNAKCREREIHTQHIKAAGWRRTCSGCRRHQLLYYSTPPNSPLCERCAKARASFGSAERQKFLWCFGWCGLNSLKNTREGNAKPDGNVRSHTLTAYFAHLLLLCMYGRADAGELKKLAPTVKSDEIPVGKMNANFLRRILQKKTKLIFMMKNLIFYSVAQMVCFTQYNSIDIDSKSLIWCKNVKNEPQPLDAP